MSQLIVSLETKSLEESKGVVDKLGPEVEFYKVGLPLFVKEGPEVVKFLHDQGKKVFLDLKFYDIPSVTKRAVQSACDLGAFMVNLHGLSGEKILKEVATLKDKYSETKIIGVTFLTSYSEEELRSEGLLQGQESVEDRVLALAKKIKAAGLDGVVSSVHETKKIKEVCGSEFLSVTPGIRLEKGPQDDQARVATVEEAVGAGSDYLVVGRPIVNADDPKEASLNFLSRMK